MKHEEADTRRTLVRRVRIEFRPHFFSRCLELAYRIIPCCNSCEYNAQGFCAAPQLTFSDGISYSGLAIKDGDTLCLQWSPAPAAIITAMHHAYKEDLQSKPKPAPEPKTPQRPQYSPAALAEQIRRFHAGETSAADAAEALKMGLSTFYHKAKGIPHNDTN